MEGTLLADEAVDAKEDAAKEHVNMVKRAKERLAAASKQQRHCSTTISGEVLRGLSVYVEDASEAGALIPALTKLGCHMVLDRYLATAFVVPDLGDLGCGRSGVLLWWAGTSRPQAP